MAAWIKQGDSYALPMTVKLNGEPLAIQEVEAVEFTIGGVRKTYPEELFYDPTEGRFYVPLSQEETFGFPAGEAVAADLRVKFHGGNVIGVKRMVYVTVFDAVSEEVL